MNIKKHIGQFISVKFKDKKTPINGYVIDSNDNWTLMKHNPHDYVIDGYIIFRHKNIEGLYRNKEEKWKEKVISLKGLQPTDKEIIPINDLKTILKYLTDNFGVFGVYTKSEKTFFAGKLNSIQNKDILLDDLNTKGKWDRQLKFRTSDIRVIEFDTDYTNTLKLLSNSY